MDALAARLGIGARHMRRLFIQHLGASPIAVVQTRRLHFAKKLIDETRLEMRQIALASGFGSVRRFNATFQKTYGRSPSHLRSLHREAQATSENEYRFSLRYRPPFAWTALLEFLAPRAIPGVEYVDGAIYRRTFELDRHIGWLEASLDEPNSAVSLRIKFPDTRWLFLIVERVRRLFDLSADPDLITQHLSSDRSLHPLIARWRGLRIPGAWDGFELAVRAILGQQVTVAGATTLSGRLVHKFGTPVVIGEKLTHLFPSAAKLADADLTTIGLPKARARTINLLAQAVEDGKICFSGMVNGEEFAARFCEIPGIGPWTAQYVAMRALGEPDAFPTGDLGLLRAVNLKQAKDLEARAEAWRPWRAYAAMYLWQGAHHERRVLHTNAKPSRAAAAGGR